MAKNTGRILADELHRILEEFVDLDAEIRMLVEERKRLATVAHNLQRILYSTVRPKTAEKLIEELGLAEMISKLPGVPGRKPAAPAPVKPAKKQPGPAPKAKVTKEEAPTLLKKGTGVRMLAGKYTDWTGIIRWVSIKGTRITYAVALTGPDGKSAPTQVAPSSMGKKWVVDATVVPPKKKGRKTRRKGATKKKTAAKGRKTPKT